MLTTTFRGWVWLLLWLRHLPYPPIYISSCYQTQKVDGWKKKVLFFGTVFLSLLWTHTRAIRIGGWTNTTSTHKNGKWWTIRLAIRHLGSPSVSHKSPTGNCCRSPCLRHQNQTIRKKDSCAYQKVKKFLIFFQENKN